MGGKEVQRGEEVAASSSWQKESDTQVLSAHSVLDFVPSLASQPVAVWSGSQSLQARGASGFKRPEGCSEGSLVPQEPPAGPSRKSRKGFQEEGQRKRRKSISS